MKYKKLFLFPTLILGASSLSGCSMLCTVTWLDWDDTVLEVDEHVFPLEFAKYDGKNPERETTAEFTFKFAGWDTTPKRVLSKNTVFKAVYESTRRSYEVIWKDSEGVTLKKETLPYGTMPSFTPEKESDAQYDYEFVKWDKEVTKVTGDVTYTTTWKKNIRSYNVKWVDYDGTVLDSEVYEYGTMPSFSKEEPVRADNPDYVYTFAGFRTEDNKEISKVTGDVTYVAQYNVRDAEFFDVQLIVKSELYEKMTVREHEDRTLPSLLTYEESAYCGYDVAWFFDKAFVVPVENTIEDIVSDMKFYGQIPAEPHKFTITYNMGDGEDNDPTNPAEIDYTQDVVLADPSKVGFDFLGWFDEDGNQVTELSSTLSDITLTPRFEEATYHITFEANDRFDPECVLEPLPVKYNSEPVLPNPIMRPGYRFLGWKIKGTDDYYSGVYTFTEDITLEADTEIIEYTITYNDSQFITTPEGDYDTTYNVENITTVTLPEVEKEGYIWDHTWRAERTSNGQLLGSSISSLLDTSDYLSEGVLACDVTLTPNLQEAQKYNVTFDYNGGSKQLNVYFNGANQSVSKTVTYGVNELEYFALEDRQGYQFAGWENFPENPISEDVVVNAKWESINADYVAARIGEETEVPFHNSNTVYCQFVSLIDQDLVISTKTDGLYVIVDHETMEVDPNDCKEEEGVFTYKGTMHVSAGEKYVLELAATDNGDGTTLLNIENANNESILPNLKITAASIQSETRQFAFNSYMRGLPIPEKQGYNFLGWYKEGAEDELFEDGKKLEIAENFTLVAHWADLQE